MNLEKARELLKVQKGASFDEVLKAKKKLKDGKDLEEGQVTMVRSTAGAFFTPPPFFLHNSDFLNIFFLFSSRNENKIDAAYDVLLMDSLRNRQEGRGVSKDVRYADVPKAKPVSQVANELLQKLPGNVQVSVGSRGRANQDESVTERVRQSVNAQNVTFGIISLWVYLQVSPPPFPVQIKMES